MSKNIVNYYKILNIPNDANAEQIKRAYKYLVLTKHPDVNKAENAREEFMYIIKAYNILRDETRRAEYDAKLKSESSFFDKINFKYVCDKVVGKSTKAIKKLSKFVKSIAVLSSPKYDVSRFSTECDIPPEVMAMSKMETSELEMRLEASDNMFVRAYSAFALGVKGDRMAIGTLENALHDSELTVREKAVWSIGKLGMKKSLPVLQSVFANSGSIMRQEIIKAVYEITGGHGKVFKSMINEQNDINNSSMINAKINLHGLNAENKMINV